MPLGRRDDVHERDRLDLETQRARLREVPIEQRLEEVLAWSAVLLADELQRSAGRHRVGRPPPVDLGSRRP